MSDTTYDAVVVGARCVGAPNAMLLARSGHRVLLLDRGCFPSDTLSTHWIHQPGVALLRRWGLLRNVVESGCPPIDKVTLDFGPLSLSGSPLAADGIVSSYAPAGWCWTRSWSRQLVRSATAHPPDSAPTTARSNFISATGCYVRRCAVSPLKCVRQVQCVGCRCRQARPCSRSEVQPRCSERCQRGLLRAPRIPRLRSPARCRASVGTAASGL